MGMMAKPEVFLRATSDATFDAIRTADDFKNRVDNTRFKIEVSCDTAGRKELQNTLKMMFDGNQEPLDILAASSMFKGFKFKAKANSKEQAGSMNDNFQKTLEAMQMTDLPQVRDAHKMMVMWNDE